MGSDEIQDSVTRHAQRDMAKVPTASHDPHPAHPRKSGRPSTASLLWGLWREGLKDLQNVVLNPFPTGHVAQHEEPGTIANPTQLEVYQEKHNEASGPEVFGAETNHTLSYNPMAANGRNSDDRGKGGMSR